MEEIIAKLQALLAGDEAKAKEIADKAAADGVTDAASAAMLTETEWAGYGLTKIAARKLVADLKKATAPAPAAAAPAASVTTMLPPVPADDAFLDSLRVGGTLKPTTTDVLSAVRAVFVSRLGLEDLEDRVLELMEQRALKLGEQCGDVYYEVEKAKGKKMHAEVLRALGVRGDFVSNKRKAQFLGRMSGLWTTLSAFQAQIHGWRQTWQSNVSNPAALMQAFAAMASGGAAAALAGGFNDAPDTAPIIDAATAVIDDINKMFAGTGVPVARALAADAVQIRQLIEKPELIAGVGATTRDEMLKTLDIAVGADLVRAERSVAQYVLGIVELPKVPETQLSLYIVALENLGSGIPWDKLSAGSPANRRSGGTF